MTMFLESRGWMIDLARLGSDPATGSGRRHVGLAMTFEGDAGVPRLVAEQVLDQGDRGVGDGGGG